MTRKFFVTVLSITVVLGIVSCSSEISEVRFNEIEITASTETSGITIESETAEKSKEELSAVVICAETIESSESVQDEEPPHEDLQVRTEPTVRGTVSPSQTESHRAASTPTPKPTATPKPTSTPKPTPTIAPVHDPRYTRCVADFEWEGGDGNIYSGTVRNVPCRRNSAGDWIPTSKGEDMIADDAVYSGGWSEWIIEGSERDFS